MDRVPEEAAARPLAVLSRFRREFHACLTARADELSELADAVLCADGPVRNLAGLSLVPEHRRGHGALYDAANHGRIDIARLRRSLAGLPLPRAADGRLMLAVDVSNWLRPGAATSPDRLFCHVYGRGKGQAQMIPGWPYSVIAALEPGRTSWTAVLDAVRLGPDDDDIAVTAAQVRNVITRLAGRGLSGRCGWLCRPCAVGVGGDAGQVNAAGAVLDDDQAARLLCRTARWWSRIKISAVFHVSSRRASCSHAASRVVRRNMNRRHMIDDHHGRTAGRATLLARAMDEIFGTRGVCGGILTVFTPSLAKITSKTLVNLASRSRMMKRNGEIRSPRSMTGCGPAERSMRRLGGRSGPGRAHGGC